MAAPTTTDLQNLLNATGLPSSAITALSGQLAGAINASIEAFQRETGRFPFIAETDDSTRLFDPPGDSSSSSTSPMRMGGEKILELPFPYRSITSISTGLSPSNSDGKLLTPDVDYFLKPNGYDLKGKAIEWVEFRMTVLGGSNSVEIVGKAGSYTDWPADAFQAVLSMAAASLAPLLMTQVSGGYESWEEADVKEKVGAGQFETFRSMFLGADGKHPASVQRVIQRYRFVRVGL